MIQDPREADEMRESEDGMIPTEHRHRLLETLLLLVQQCAVAKSLAEVADSTADLLRSLFSAAAAHVMLRREESGLLETFAYSGVGREVINTRKLALNEGIAGVVLAQSKPVYVADIGSDPRWEWRDELRAAGLESAFLAPLLLDTEPVGMLEVYNPAMPPQGPSPEDESVLMAFAAHAAGALRVVQARQRAQDESDRLRVVLDSIPLPALVIDGADLAHATIELQNRASREAAGMALAPGTPVQELSTLYAIYPADCTRPYALEEIPALRALQRGEVIYQEEVHIRLPGDRWLVGLASAAPMRRGGKVTGAVVVFEDITHRVREEEKVRRRYDQLRVIYDTATAVSEAEDLAQIYEKALDGLTRALGTDRASLLLLDADQVMRFKAWRGLSEEYRKAVEGHTPWPPDVQDPRPVLIADVARAPESTPLPEVLQTEGIRAIAFIPLVHHHRLVGKLMVYYGEPHVFTDEEVQVAQTIAYHIAYAIERHRTTESLRLSESRYRMLMEQASDPIAVLDAEGQILAANARTAETTGYTREELVGMNVTHLFVPSELSEHPLHLPELRAGKTVVTERQVRTKDGSIRIAEVSARLLPDGRIQAIARDITERKRDAIAQRFLAEASRLLASSLDYETTLSQVARLAVPGLGDWCFVYIFDSGLERTEVATADPADEALAKKLVGFPPPTLKAVCEALPDLCAGEAHLFESVHPDVLAAIARSPEHLEQMRALGAHSAMLVPMEVRGRVLGAINIVSTRSARRYTHRDLTQAMELGRRAALAIENARLYREAQDANRAKDHFITVISHELRNPLAPILAGVDMLRHLVTEDGRLRRTLEIIDRNARLQARLVNDLLDLSRVARGKIELRCVPVALDTIVRSAIQGQQSDLADARLSLHVDLQSGLWVNGDADRLQQVVMNLLSNAIKFTPAGGEIRVSCRAQDPGHARIVVEDTGIGIAPEQLPRLFRMFEQGKMDKHKGAGMGIGLALVKALVERHGGSVTAESEGPGKGSRFTVELPLIPAPETASADNRLQQAPDHLRVLLVEGDPDTREILVTALGIVGYSVTSAPSGEEALERAREERPGLILADVDLPGMDGYEFLKRARALPGMQSVPALMLTGDQKAIDVQRTREAGFPTHLTKPVDPDALEARIRELVQAGPQARTEGKS